MSVDFHIPKRQVISVPDLLQGAAERLAALTPPERLPSIAISQWIPEQCRGIQPTEIGNAQAIYRVELSGKTHVFLTYLVMPDRQVYLVTLNVGQPPLNILWAVAVAEAVCELGGTGIDDEGFISDGVVDSKGLLPPGRLSQLLRSNRRAVLDRAVKVLSEEEIDH